MTSLLRDWHGTGRVNVPGIHVGLTTFDPTLNPATLRKKRSKSTIVLGLFLTMFVLSALYYMIFVIAVPCGVGLSGHWTIWQMINGIGCH